MMAGVGFGLGVSGGLVTGQRPWLGQWWRDGALSDADFANGRFRFGGLDLNSEAAWLSAIGGVGAGNARTIGPYQAADAIELVTNGDFATGSSGWTAQNGASFSVVSGEGVLEANGVASPGFSRGVPSEPGQAYAISGTYRRGTNTTGCGLLYSTNPNGSPTIATSQANNTTSAVTAGATGGGEATTMYVGTRIFAGAGTTGTAVFDNISVKKVAPFAGYHKAGFSVRIKGRTPATLGAGDKVLFQADHGATASGDGSARNRVRVFWDNSGHLRLLVNYAAPAVAALDLGLVQVSTDFEVMVSAATNEFRAALVGGPVQFDGLGNMPAMAVMRIGRSFAGEAWDGGIDRVTVQPALGEAEFYAGNAIANSIVAWGDSLTAGTGATVPFPELAGVLYTPKRSVVNMGIGGQTTTEIAARLGGLPVQLTVTSDFIPASGPVTVTARAIDGSAGIGPITSLGAQSFAGTLAGVQGTLSRDGSDVYSFTRSQAGDAVACPPGSVFTLDLDIALRGRTAWLMPGRNNASSGRDDASDLAAMVGHLGHSRYLVGSVLTANTDTAGTIASINARNAARAALYGSRYVDTITLLRAAVDGSAGDAADVAAGYTPRSKRSDAVHLNDGGYVIIAAAFKAANDAMGW